MYTLAVSNPELFKSLIMDFCCSFIIWHMITLQKGLEVKIDISVIIGPKCSISFHIQDLCEW